MPIITAWTVFFCAIFYMFLTLRVIRARGEAGVSLGDGGDAKLLRRMRGQANANEHMPLTLLALGLAELMGGEALVLVPLAILFTLSRVAHGVALGWLNHSRTLRFWGMFIGSLTTMTILGYLGFLALLASFS